MNQVHEKFTLTELLIVIAIIAILASLMLPALNNAREKSKATQCVNNKKQAMMAQIQYSGDYNNYYIITMQHPGDNTSYWLGVRHPQQQAGCCRSVFHRRKRLPYPGCPAVPVLQQQDPRVGEKEQCVLLEQHLRHHQQQLQRQ